MKNLSSLLERLTGALHADARLRLAVSESVQECAGGLISDKDLEIKDGVLTIHASPALKNELRLKEKRLLDSIYEKSGKHITRIIYA